MIEFVVYCPKHKHYLVRESVAGTTWSDAASRAHRYTSDAEAQLAARNATWLTHDPEVHEVEKVVL